jgi:hypothetical protein
MGRCDFAKSIRPRTGHVDGRVEIEPELFTTGWIARVNHETIIEALGIPRNDASGKTITFAPEAAASSISRTALSTHASLSKGTAPACTTATRTVVALIVMVILPL